MTIPLMPCGASCDGERQALVSRSGAASAAFGFACIERAKPHTMPCHHYLLDYLKAAGSGDDRWARCFVPTVRDTKTVHCQALCWMPLASFSLEKGRHWRIV